MFFLQILTVQCRCDKKVLLEFSVVWCEEIDKHTASVQCETGAHSTSVNISSITNQVERMKEIATNCDSITRIQLYQSWSISRGSLTSNGNNIHKHTLDALHTPLKKVLPIFKDKKRKQNHFLHTEWYSIFWAYKMIWRQHNYAADSMCKKWTKNFFILALFIINSNFFFFFWFSPTKWKVAALILLLRLCLFLFLSLCLYWLWQRVHFT